MPLYNYISYDKSKKKETGSITSPDEKTAGHQLKERGLTVISLKTKSSSANLSLNLIKSVPAKEKIIFTRQLAIMIKSGMPFAQALTALSEQTENHNLKNALEKINQDVKGGATLSSSLAKFPHIFSTIYVSVVASGEKSGKLEEVLNNLADQQEKDYDLVSKVKSAMVYPIVILIALIGVIFLIMFYIMPQLQPIFKEFGGDELPFATQLLFSFSKAVKKYFYLFALGIIILAIIIKFALKTESGITTKDKLILRLPIFGMMTKKLYMARFTRTMAMLIGAGLPMLEVIQTAGNVINNAVYKKSLAKLHKDVEGGIPLSESLKQDKNFPIMISHMLAVGEQSGKIDYVLNQIASFFEKEVDNLTKNLSSIIEPLLMVFMGIGVGFVVVSVLGPISNMTNNM